MTTMNRREMLLAVSAMAAISAISAEAQTKSTAETALSHSTVYPFDKLPIKHSANGGASRAVLRGVLPTGESIEMHETTLPPGQMPHPPHRHLHSELMMVRTGTLEINNDGKLETIGPGGVFLAASNVMHGIKCVGDTPANYFVIAIGVESPSQTSAK